MSLQVSTGIGFLDAALDGGQLKAGVHGLLGPYGGGKTTLATMIAVEGAKLQFQQALDGKAAGHWVFCTFGQHGRDIRWLASSHAAKVDRDVLLRPVPSDRRQSQPYELARADELRGPNGFVPSEQERLQLARQLLERHFTLVDCSSVTAFGAARTPIEYLAGQLDAVAQRGPIAGVVLDYVGAFVEVFGDWARIRFSRRSAVIRQLVHETRPQIAERFSCPVWLVHQLRGAVQQRSATTPMHHDDAAECRHFGDELDACVCLGNMDTFSRCLLLNVSKTPAMRETPPEPVVLRFDPNFASLVQAREFRRSHTTRTIIRDGRGLVTMDGYTREVLERMIRRDRK